MSEPKERIMEDLAAIVARKNRAYWERNQLVRVLSVIFSAHLTRHPDSDTEWEDDWRNIVCIHGPTGQMTWHLHDSEVHDFQHLSMTANDWDGHTDEQKYDRLARIKSYIPPPESK